MLWTNLNRSFEVILIWLFRESRTEFTTDRQRSYLLALALPPGGRRVVGEDGKDQKLLSRLFQILWNQQLLSVGTDGFCETAAKEMFSGLQTALASK